MVDAIQIQRLYESRTFTFILCNEIIWGLKGERMDIREKIADLQHDQWVGWMKYLFSKCYFKDGCYVIPQWAQARWSRQMETPYNELPLDERDSDRKEADKVLALIEQYYVSPEMVKGLIFEVQAKKCANCPKNKEVM